MRTIVRILPFVATMPLLAAAPVVLARSSPAALPRLAVGGHPSDCAFSDLRGGQHVLLGKASLPAVYLFLSTDCPVANSYTPRIRRLARLAQSSGLHFLGVYPNAADTVAAIRRSTSARGYSFTIVRDGGRLAGVLGAASVPEAVVLDRAGAIAYRGRIDDDVDPARVRRHDLADAIQAIAAGSDLRRETTAVGCAIQPGLPVARSRTSLTYARDIQPILDRNCVACHRSGEVAPFSMESYQTVAKWAEQIRVVTQRRTMPPWKADSHGEFLNERRLNDAQVSAIGQWVDAGAPAGDLRQVRVARKPAAASWRLGEPDLVVGAKEPMTLAAEGRDLYHCFVIPTNYSEDRYISAVEVHPGNRAVVHHVIAWLDTSGAADRLDAASGGKGYDTTGGAPKFLPAGMLGGWAPGNEAAVLPAGTGILLPRGGRIVMEVHYHRDGKPEIDQTHLGLHFCKGPVSKRLRFYTVMNPLFDLAPGDADNVVRASTRVRQPITVLAVMPHMHLLGKSMRVAAAAPGEAERQLVSIKDWDFNWQTTYALKQPMHLPAGVVISTVAHYDNSEANPNNPNRPPRHVRWGEQTTDEMNLAFVFYTLDDEDLTAGRAPVMHLGQQ